MCIVGIHEPTQDKTGIKDKQIFFLMPLLPSYKNNTIIIASPPRHLACKGSW